MGELTWRRHSGFEKAGKRQLTALRSGISGSGSRLLSTPERRRIQTTLALGALERTADAYETTYYGSPHR